MNTVRMPRTENACLNIGYTIREFGDVCQNGEESDIPGGSLSEFGCHNTRVRSETHSWLLRFPLRIGNNARAGVIVTFSATV